MAGQPFQDKEYKIIAVYNMSKERIKIDYITALVQLPLYFHSVLHKLYQI